MSDFLEQWQVEALEKLRRARQFPREMEQHWGRLFGTRVVTVLKNEGIVTEEALAAMTDAQLLSLPNFGKVCLFIVRQTVPQPGIVCPRCGHSWKT